MGNEPSSVTISRRAAKAASSVGSRAYLDGRQGYALDLSWQGRDLATPAGTGADLLPVMGAALGGLLLTCSAFRACYNRRIRSLEHEVVRLSDIADRDHLTGLGNRRSFEQRLAVEWRRAVRNNSHLTLALMDIDFFKRFNDTYGHPSGDRALRRVAGCLSGILGRAADSAFRVGGEEFALILPDTDQAGATLVGNRVCTAVRSAGIAHENDVAQVLTTSFGSCSAIIGDGDKAEALLSHADQALYEAKRTGRNRAVCIRCRPSTDRGEMEAAAALNEAAVWLEHPRRHPRSLRPHIRRGRSAEVSSANSTGSGEQA